MGLFCYIQRSAACFGRGVLLGTNKRAGSVVIFAFCSITYACRGMCPSHPYGKHADTAVPEFAYHSPLGWLPRCVRVCAFLLCWHFAEEAALLCKKTMVVNHTRPFALSSTQVVVPKVVLFYMAASLPFFLLSGGKKLRLDQALTKTAVTPAVRCLFRACHDEGACCLSGLLHCLLLLLLSSVFEVAR